MKSLIEIKQYASKCHESTGHMYDKKYPYSFHLKMVEGYVFKYNHLIDNKESIYGKDSDVVIAIIAAWCHDLIEDTRQTYNDVKKYIGEKAADIVYALTNEKGKNRAERANDKYYAGIKSNKIATFVKICDRLANTRHSVNTNSPMLETYRKELPEFIDKLYTPDFTEMFTELSFLTDGK